MNHPSLAIIDYGASNLGSVAKALETLGYSPVISSDPKIISKAHTLILPGQGRCDRAMKCLDLLKTRKYRTCIRLTMIKDENMNNEDQYADLIRRGSPDVIELKSYVHVGESRRFYSQENMPTLDEMKVFMDKLLIELPEYEFIRQHIPSRAILLIRKDLNKKAWINFPKFFELIEQGKQPTTEEYSSVTMTNN